MRFCSQKISKAMLSSQEQLARYEKNNRHMFLTGCFFVLLVVAFWVIVAMNTQDCSRVFLESGTREQQILSRLRTIISSPSPREKALLAYCETLIIITGAIIKIFTVKFIAMLVFIIGILMVGFAQYEKKVLKLAREALGTK